MRHHVVKGSILRAANMVDEKYVVFDIVADKPQRGQS